MISLIKRSTGYCPNCNACFWVKAGIFADDLQHICGNCRTTIDIKLKWGKIKSVASAPVVDERYKGYEEEYTTLVSDRQYLGGDEQISSHVQEGCQHTRFTWWKEYYGNDWKQEHDEWEHEDDIWWKEHVGYVPCENLYKEADA